MEPPIHELFPDLTRCTPVPWNRASKRERMAALDMVFSDRFKLTVDWSGFQDSRRPGTDRMIDVLEWSLRHGRPHIALWPIATPLVRESVLEFWRELEWRQNPATPIELVCPELVDHYGTRDTWATLDAPTKLRRLRLVFQAHLRQTLRLGANADMPTERQVECLEWSLRHETPHAELEAYTLALSPGEVPERFRQDKTVGGPLTMRRVMLRQLLSEL